MTHTKLSLIILLQIFLAGCSIIPLNLYNEEPELQEIGQDPLITLMQDYTSLENLDSKTLKTVFSAIQEKFLDHKTDEDRIRYILLLTLPNQEFYNRNSALTLLKEWPQIDQRPPSIVSFRSILIKRLEEEQRLSISVNRLSQQLEQEKQQTNTLQKKVDDIKDLEKNLIKRMLP